VSFNNILYFSADNGSSGRELWRSDGTSGGTYAVFSQPGSVELYPTELFVFSGSLFFSGYAPTTGQELWVSDGTTAGTHLFKDLVPGSAGSYPTDFHVMNGVLYFSAGDFPDCQLWRSNGTPGGTVPITLTYSWDVNGDADFGDASGVAPTLNWVQLQDRNVDDSGSVELGFTDHQQRRANCISLERWTRQRRERGNGCFHGPIRSFER
jgi:ELWxxDGT repeat protein